MRKGFRSGKHPDEKKQKEAKKDFDARMEGFLKEFRPLSVKYKIGPGAVINRQPDRNLAMAVWLDEKPMYEAKAAQEKANLAKETPNGLIV